MHWREGGPARLLVHEGRLKEGDAFAGKSLLEFDVQCDGIPSSTT
jgi:hypothetical protein